MNEIRAIKSSALSLNLRQAKCLLIDSLCYPSPLFAGFPSNSFSSPVCLSIYLNSKWSRKSECSHSVLLICLPYCLVHFIDIGSYNIKCKFSYHKFIAVCFILLYYMIWMLYVHVRVLFLLLFFPKKRKNIHNFIKFLYLWYRSKAHFMS